MQTSTAAPRKSAFIILMIVIAGVIIGGLAAGSLPALRNRISNFRSGREISAYSRSHTIRKLQLGAGGVDYPEWLNTDIEPVSGEVYLDATRQFPISDETIHYIFGEHVIEHLTYEQGLFLLRECYRVLASGGKIRFATPNLQNYIRLFQEPKTSGMQDYIREKLKVHGWPAGSKPELTILNMEMRSFGHQFLYDRETLSERLTQAGFRNIVQFPPGESDDPQLRGTESRHKNFWQPVNDYESLVLQAERP